MSACIVSFQIQKGGTGKTTTASITAFLLAELHRKRVLAIDFDSQGNMTQMLSQRSIYSFEKTVLDACKQRDTANCIHSITDNLHILPANDTLASLTQFLYSNEYRRTQRHVAYCLKDTLESVKDNYDYIIIDSPPNLGEHTLNALSTSDYVVTILQTEPFCYEALDRYLAFVELVKQQLNPDLRLLGILPTMSDLRMSIDTSILQQAREEYEDIVFQTVIKRRSRIKEYSLTGIQLNSKADKEALQQYIDFLEEMIQRVES